MAFRVPTHAPPQRQQQHSYPTAARPASIDTTPQNQEDEGSQEWVLFSPSQTTSNDFTHTSSTERTPRTAAGLSRFSDFGSLETAARSLGTDDEAEEPEDDGTELDSLDDGLPAFREPATLSNNRPSSSRRYGGQSDPAILPTHDGLGTFQASSQSVQDHLWQHELNNPRRRHGEQRPRRQSSVQRRLDTVDEREGPHLDHDRWQRIEAWRMEQSRALLHEIEKETRRRRRNSRRASLRSEKPAEQDNIDVTGRKRPKLDAEHTASLSPDTEDQSEEETFWTRITRKVIKELMGIDESLLSVIFGESLPQENDAAQHSEGEDERRIREEKMMSDINLAAQGDGSWQDKLLERIARELGILVHQICEHPGAFSTYLRSSTSAANEYAGIPICRPSPSSSSPRPPQPPRSASDNSIPHSSTHSPHFFPTLQDAAPTHESLWGIEEEENYPFTSNPRTGTTPNAPGSRQEDTPESIRLRQEREYWERQLDVNMVFQYLRSRFGKGSKANPNPPPPNPRGGRHPQPSNSNNNSSHHQDLSHRAAIIRQHHPLVARAHARSQTQFQHQLQVRTSNSGGNLSSPSSPIRHHHPHIRRASSSCASQSSKVSISTSRTLGVVGSGSSRNYWDIGGSVGSGRRGAAVVSVGGGSLAGGVGSWGEV
ncbi:hypothetical protein FQN54_001047 [Arachnomyces sp. PD_36]|nr:hypothetical protein FQN54_001047 [Arachnomyces sp. PD_36]